jgi:hypothetical protein
MINLLLAFLVPIFLFSSPLEELLKLFDIPPAELVEGTQRLWLQQGKERWQYEKRYEQLRPQVWPLFDELGMLQEVKPTKTHYNTVLIFGALLSRVQDRVDYLVATGVTFDQLVFLTGERPLLASEKEQLPGLATESEMAKWVYQNAALSKQIPVLFIDVPMKGAQRPNTLDTVVAWLDTAPLPSSCLAISNQPYVHYQGAILDRYVPFDVEMVGPSVLGDPSVDLMLDTLARELYYKYGE